MRGYYTRREVAQLFEIHPKRVDEKVDNGMIPKPFQKAPGHKAWWRASDIDQILKGAA